MIQIESNIPIPPAHVSRGPMYPFNDMQVADSFAVPRSEAKKIRTSASQFARRKGWKFASRVIGDQIRVWRIL